MRAGRACSWAQASEPAKAAKIKTPMMMMTTSMVEALTGISLKFGPYCQTGMICALRWIKEACLSNLYSAPRYLTDSWEQQ